MAASKQLPLIIMALVSVLLAAGAVVYVVLQGQNQAAPVPVAANKPAPQQTPPPVSQPAATPLSTPYGTKTRSFTYKNPDAKSVQLTGNFDLWQPEEMTQDSRGNWTISKELPRGVPLEYQFIVDGTKMPDPQKMNNAVPDETGTLKSVYTIPKFDPTPRIASDTPTPTPTPAVIIAPALMGADTTGTTTTTAPAADTPFPTPEPVNLATLAATPADWPKTVTLKDGNVVFPVIINGKVAGQIQASPGMQVGLVKVTPEQLTISFQGSLQIVPVSSTDLIERVQASRKH